MVVERRLEAIEQKLDKLTDAFVALARVEEKQTAALEKIGSIETRLEIVEKSSDKNSYFTRSVERLIWVIVAAVAAYLFRQF